MTINCKGRLIDLAEPKVMGIINITPDSFYDGGSLKTDSELLNKAAKMIEQGATFLDIGGYSSRPGADDISIDEELRRIIPAIEIILKNYPEALIGIDTFRSKIAKEAVFAGAAMVNDISAGLLDDEMINTVGQLKVPYIIMHMKGNPRTMKNLTKYNDILHEMTKYFSEALHKTNEAKIMDVIIDPGFGFSKTLEQNYEVLKNLYLLQNIDRPMLVGISRKSMVYKPLNSSASEALNGTTALNMMALKGGANILRVHDVKEAVECVMLHKMLV